MRAMEPKRRRKTDISSRFFTFYLVNTNFTRTYETQYGLDSGTVGLCYLPMAAGSIVGGLVGGRFSDKVYNRRVAKAENQHTYPEMRLGGWLFYGGVLTQLAALVVYGWCIRYNVHYSVGLVCLFFGKWVNLFVDLHFVFQLFDYL